MVVDCEFFSLFFFFSSRRRHTRCLSDWSSDVCSSDLRLRGCAPAEVESSFDPRARSPEGAAGLFQLMPSTAKRYGLRTWPLDQRLRSEERRVGKECRSRW